MKEEASEFCGIKANDGTILALLEKNGKLEVVKNPIFIRGKNDKLFVSTAQGDIIFNNVAMSSFSRDCDNAQILVEGDLWEKVTKELKLPNGCTPAIRLKQTTP